MKLLIKTATDRKRKSVVMDIKNRSEPAKKSGIYLYSYIIAQICFERNKIFILLRSLDSYLQKCFNTALRKVLLLWGSLSHKTCHYKSHSTGKSHGCGFCLSVAIINGIQLLFISANCDPAQHCTNQCGAGHCQSVIQNLPYCTCNYRCNTAIETDNSSGKRIYTGSVLLRKISLNGTDAKCGAVNSQKSANSTIYQHPGIWKP